MNDAVTINEVGPRDGLQHQAVAERYDDKLLLIQALLDAGVRSIDASSFVSPTRRRKWPSMWLEHRHRHDHLAPIECTGADLDTTAT